MEQIGIGTGSHQAAHQAILKHIAGAAGILADDNAGRLVGTGTMLQLAIVPAQETTNLKSMVCGQIAVGLSAEAVRSKIFTHKFLLYWCLATTTPPVFQI